MKIEINKLIKNYGDKEVLKGLDLKIDNVKSVGIFGMSGCGKSTLLRQLAGLEHPEQGEITVDELSPQNQRIQYQADIGVVFQKHNLFPHLSVRRNITLVLEKFKKMNIDEANVRADEVMKTLRIFDEADKKPGKISGGQAQRASIARALATKPKYIFLDEPTASLDPILTKEVLQSVMALKGSGINFVFVTHEMKFLKEFADYFVFMQDGKIIEHGRLDIIKDPQSKELKYFLSVQED